MKVYRDEYFKIESKEITENDDIFETILNLRKNEIDQQRFYLKFLPQEIASQYDFSNPVSMEKFQDIAYTAKSPLMGMGGYNMAPRYLERDDPRLYGIKMSDPYGNIYGSFDIKNGIVTYHPEFCHFYEERDLGKFANANDTYFTTMTFEQIMLKQISISEKFYINVGQYHKVADLAKYGRYVLEGASKDQMIEFVQNPEAGAKILKRLNKI